MMPTAEAKLRPGYIDPSREAELKVNRRALTAPSGRRDLKRLHVGDTVRMQPIRTGEREWRQARVKRAITTRAFEVEADGRCYRGVGGSPSPADRFRLYPCNMHSADCARTLFTQHMSPSSLQSSTLVPILKDKRKSLSLSDNYRAIALSSPICKVLDTVILRKYGDLLSTCDLQNGFKEHGSTNACTFMVKETIQYYLQNGSNVYGTVLDATKAFDRIDFCKLFREMIIRKIPPLVIRLIMEMYEKQSMAVRWNNEYSDSFGVSNGVKQGGVLSPILFCIYIDNLLMSLKKNDIGCHVGSHFCGAFGYADDIMLLSPSVSGLQNMLDCCSEFASTYNVKFNPSKSKCITFSQKKNIYM